MEPLVFTPTYELFLVLEPFGDCFEELVGTLAPLDDNDHGPQLLAADAYYRAATDVALLALRFDERTLSYAALTWVLDLAAGAGMPALDPARLGERDRRRFYDGYLADYDLHIEDRPTVRAAVLELGRRLDLVSGVEEPPPPSRRARTMTGPGALGPRTPPRPPRLPTAPYEDEPTGGGTRPMPPDVVPPGPGAQARMRRLGSSPRSARATSGHRPLGKLSPRHDSPDDRRELSLVEQAARARARGEHRAPTVRDRPDEDTGPTDVDPVQPRGKGKARKRTPTMPATPIAKKPPGSAPGETSGTGPGRAPPHREPPREEGVRVQFLRGSQWIPARLRSLSSKGAYLVTGAPPRLGDHVHIALDYADMNAMALGTVHHVTTPEDALSTGSSGFAIRFPQVDNPARRQLVALLKRARHAGVTIKPPPARRAVRFPVRWPVRVHAGTSGFGAAALDVSAGGLFVATEQALDESDELIFRLPLDNGDTAVCGRAQIARAVDQRMASTRGLERGYGLRIVELAGSDGRRYEAFLDRVRRRTDKRVVVGATPERARELCGELVASGYSVTSSSDPGVLVRLADLEPRAPDAALIDDSLFDEWSRQPLLEQAFAARSVPCLTTSDVQAGRARGAVDRLLLA